MCDSCANARNLEKKSHFHNDLEIQVEKQNRPRIASGKFASSQIKTSSQKATTTAVKPTTSLLDILRKTSIKLKHSTQDNTVSQTESVLASFKLAKRNQ